MSGQTNTKSRNWSITINNPTQEDFAQIESLKTTKGWFREWVGQLEKGEEGTEHVQAYLKTDNVSFSQVKKCLPRAHIEAARNTLALKNYVQKSDTRLSAMPQTKAAGLGDIQKKLNQVVFDHLYHKGLPLYFHPSIFRMGKWIYQKRELPEDTPWDEVIDKNDTWLQQHKSDLLDDAINRMIREGWYGVEMYGSNNLTRSAFLKYFSAILIRTHAINDAPPPPPAPPQSSEEDYALD